MNRFLQKTKLLNYEHKFIVDLNSQKKWSKLTKYEKIKQIYNFVQNEILFGYPESDNVRASDVLEKKMGNGITKSILLMALLRSNEISCRFKGLKIKKNIHNGAVTGIAYLLFPQKMIHGWTEVFYQDKWIILEGVTVDKNYLNKVLSMFPDKDNEFNEYGIALIDQNKIKNTWSGQNTFVQRGGIIEYLDIYNSPDDFFEYYKQTLTGIKRILYKTLFMKRINKKVMKIRNGYFKIK
ncbi:MAG: transglutaminase-like domain-containing protein [Candidatus Marinimicrobia bacterium]|nr:transglutaminase-like domain-containing protein [Candidatus Neomarinimicrobiota bacterium]